MYLHPVDDGYQMFGVFWVDLGGHAALQPEYRNTKRAIKRDDRISYKCDDKTCIPVYCHTVTEKREGLDSEGSQREHISEA